MNTIRKSDQDEVYNALESVKFPKCCSRTNIGPKIEAFVLGTVNYRGQKSLQYRTRGPSKNNDKFPHLFKVLTDFIKRYKPHFKYTTIQVNMNVLSPPHVDKNNVGPSYIIALGDFKGGDLVIEGESTSILNNWKRFDGTNGHWVTPFSGTRYSLVYFTHTFKPPHPSLRYIEVKEDGLYKKGELIKRYN